MKRSRPLLILGLLTGVAAAAYLLASAAVYRIGFPLDDTWIHQTYARNLGLRGEWTFLPGVISAGSTSPLWTVVLALGYRLGLGPYVWTYACGMLSLLGLAWAGEKILRRQTDRVGNFPWMGAFLVMEWHLVWSASSGMETPLFAALILICFLLLSSKEPKWLSAGIAAGAAVWVRPDGITLLGPVGLLTLLALRERNGIKALLRAAAGFGIAFIPYILFNFAISGNIWPNTLYAKQAEYAASLQLPLLERVGSVFSLPLIGAGILLLPGMIYALWRGWRERRWLLLTMGLWWLGYNLIYSLSLPLTYQHGRYLMPSMPVFFVLGGIGFAWLWKDWLARKRWRRLLRLGWFGCIGAVELAFLGVGAITYAQDVAIIETEMVSTAHWLAENIPHGARVAVHDIGAIGYFSEVNILDTAGLISPEVIPFIRDETRLAQFLDKQGVEYLVTFPGWYPKLVKRGTLIHQTDGKFSPEAGGENMAVYRWGKP